MPELDLFIMQDMPYPGFVEMAQRAESAGCGNVWLIDGQDVFPDPWTTAALCALGTSRVRIGPGVTNPLTRHPRVTANATLSVHALSGGRAILGLGSGDNAVRTLGWRPASVSDMREAVAVCRERFARERAEIPIYLAAGGPRMLDLAADVADGVIVPGGATTVEDLVRCIRQAEAAARARGRDLDTFPILWYAGFALSEDRAEALEDARGGVARRVINFLGSRGRCPPELEHLRPEMSRVAAVYDYAEHLKSHVRHAAAVSDALVSAVSLAGTPADLLPRFQALWRAVGDSNVTFFLRPDGRHKQRSFELFADAILPTL